MNNSSIREIYDLLFARFGPQHWWPGDGPFETIVGAILTQNTSWANVTRAIDNLKNADALDPAVLHEMPPESLAALIRPAGYFNVKARRLKCFLDWLFDQYGGEVETLTQIDTVRLREELLSINGVGRETADSILLYAFGRPVFVVDAYTARIAVRHGLIDREFCDYESLRELFESNLPEDVQLFNEYHALLVCTGKDYCKPRARCPGCPLEHLPHDVDPQ